MCGISVVIERKPSQIDGKKALEKMIEAQSHRGPDGNGYHFLNWTSEKIWIGHNLLAISDAKIPGKQPFFSEDGVCGLVFNGEIYDHKSLRNTLTSFGYSFKTGSDTETLVLWLRHFGRKGLAQLEGMYAFVYWDSSKELMIMHRDSFGMKPLYFCRNRSLLVFASEPGALFASELFSISPDPSSFSFFLKYKFIPEPQSAWQGIKQLSPGEVVEYWESKPLHYSIGPNARNAPMGTLEDAMDVAFGEIIPANQPVGIMFSGGVDSSLILHWCLKHGIELRPFSIRFGVDHPLSADQKAVVEISELLNVPIHWVDISPDSMKDLVSFPKFHQPLVADSAWLLTRAIAREAQKWGIRVLLSGGGADEWFGGYRRHWFFYQWLHFHNLFSGVFKSNLLNKVKLGPFKWFDFGNATDREVWDAAVSTKLSSVLVPKAWPYIASNAERDKNLANALIWDQKHFLTQDVLALTDLATMEFGIEGRFPFLHSAIINFAEGITANQKLGQGRKWLLKNEMRNWAPKSLVDRKKQGFGLPLDLFFETGEGLDFFKENATYLFENHPQLFYKEKFLDFVSCCAKKPSHFTQEMLGICWLGSWLKNQA